MRSSPLSEALRPFRERQRSGPPDVSGVMELLGHCGAKIEDRGVPNGTPDVIRELSPAQARSRQEDGEAVHRAEWISRCDITRTGLGESLTAPKRLEVFGACYASASEIERTVGDVDRADRVLRDGCRAVGHKTCAVVGVLPGANDLVG
jgi:hypothetical protein